MNKIFNARVRTAIYGLSAVLLPAAAVVFHVTEDDWSLWTGTVLGTFDVILALSNTPVTSAESLKKEIEDAR